MAASRSSTTPPAEAPMMSGRLILLELLELFELEVEVGLTFERVLVRTVPVFNGLPVASGNWPAAIATVSL
jgi:hypothetical protein